MLNGQRSACDGAGDPGMLRARANLIAAPGFDVHIRSKGEPPCTSAGMNPTGIRSLVRTAATIRVVAGRLQGTRYDLRFMRTGL